MKLFIREIKKHQVLIFLFLIFLFSAAAFLTINLSSRYNADPALPPSESADNEESRRIIVKFRSEVSDNNISKISESYRLNSKKVIPQINARVFELPPEASQVAVVNAFKNRSDIEYVEVDRRHSSEVIPNDPEYVNQYHLPKISLPTAWDRTTGNNNIIIAILDTGIDSSHPDLISKLVPGWNIYDNNNNLTETTGHGTNTAGVVAAITQNSLGIASVCPECKIMPIRISDSSGYAYSSDIAEGITWAADHGAKIANVSFGCSLSTSVSNAASYFRTKTGGVVAVSSGNDGSYVSNPDNPNLIVVGATNQYDDWTSFSTYGNHIDVVAPGYRVLTTSLGGAYAYKSGTSFSSPIIAGIAALLYSTKSTLLSSEVDDILKNSANDLGITGWDKYYGWGRVNAEKAVLLAQGGTNPIQDTTPPVITITTPIEGAYVSGQVPISFNVKDDVKIDIATLKVNNTGSYYPTSTQVISEKDITYTYTLDTGLFINSDHLLNVVATDSSKNSSNAYRTIHINNPSDNIRPYVYFTSPSSNLVLKKTTNSTTISVSSSDNIALSRVELYINGSLRKTFLTKPFTYNWTNIPLGVHTITAISYDSSGNFNSATTTITKR